MPDDESEEAARLITEERITVNYGLGFGIGVVTGLAAVALWQWTRAATQGGDA